jgi:hypothetical protein
MQASEPLPPGFFRYDPALKSGDSLPQYCPLIQAPTLVYGVRFGDRSVYRGATSFDADTRLGRGADEPTTAGVVQPVGDCAAGEIERLGEMASIAVQFIPKSYECL